MHIKYDKSFATYLISEDLPCPWRFIQIIIIEDRKNWENEVALEIRGLIKQKSHGGSYRWNQYSLNHVDFSELSAWKDPSDQIGSKWFYHKYAYVYFSFHFQ